MRKDFEDDCILDTGDTQQMCYIKDYFWTYHDTKVNPIYSVDDTSHTPQEKGSVHFILPRIGKVLLSNVWYVPYFKNIFLSLVLIREGGHQIIMEDGLIKINLVKNKLKTMMNGYEYGIFFTIQGIVIPHNEDLTTLVDLSFTSLRSWHYRFFHLNFESLSKIKSEEMVKGLPTFKKEIAKCEACIMGKRKRDPFYPSTW
jgi:hypothetical protein